MKSDIQIRNSADVCYIDIEGTIGVPEQWQFASPDDRVATYEKFRDAVARIAALDAPQVVVNIRSTGGDVNDALLIYDALAALDAEVTTRCYGYVASAATLIAQAASEGRREISAGALYLVHAAACAAEGNAAELEARAELLRKAYACAYDPAFTDDATVVEAAGGVLRLVEGEATNLKITTRDDLAVAEAILARRTEA